MILGCLLHASVSRTLFRSNICSINTGGLTLVSFKVRNEFISASFMSGNVCGLSLRILLVSGASFRSKFETNWRYNIHNQRKDRSCVSLVGVESLVRRYTSLMRHVDSSCSLCDPNIRQVFWARDIFVASTSGLRLSIRWLWSLGWPCVRHFFSRTKCCRLSRPSQISI